MRHSFASDNHAGVHPEVLAAIAAANDGHAAAYGDDGVTARAVELFRREFGAEAAVAFVLTGSGANVVALDCLRRPHEAVIAAATAHVNLDEAGAPERFLGSKLLPVETPDGRLTPEAIEAWLEQRGDVHRVQPRVVSVTQPTEQGVCYSLEELRGLSDYVHGHGMLLHVDGARLANAAAALDCSLAEASGGADAVSFGGTKNGALAAEAVLVLEPDCAAVLPHARKQAMQLASKLRYVSAQLEALLRDGLWRRNAAQANAMARRLADAVRDLDGVELTQPQQTNGVFATLPATARARLREHYPPNDWNPRRGEVRWMTAWDTEPADVDELVDRLQTALGA